MLSIRKSRFTAAAAFVAAAVLSLTACGSTWTPIYPAQPPAQPLPPTQPKPPTQPPVTPPGTPAPTTVAEALSKISVGDTEAQLIAVLGQPSQQIPASGIPSDPARFAARWVWFVRDAADGKEYAVFAAIVFGKVTEKGFAPVEEVR